MNESNSKRTIGNDSTVFRPAKNSEISSIQKVVFSILSEYGLKADPDHTDFDLSDLDKFYFSKGGYFEVCEMNNQIVGTWGLFPVAHRTCELRKMYLLPNYRGLGLGKQMIERALAKGRELNFTRMELETASVLNEAISLYKSYGFRPISKHELCNRCDQAFELLLSE